ncbi:cell envelope-related function transcriptional attenuator common domain [Brachybacterium faecium DSM 4810]|uniref:Cell envelope-related function transcriptional attenuator common domain n=1 Tax=Brachybacterium faecium (strain ATCC 43885 / DSM 4810 / JCM 11609 / LMG 19847 / NBRC 14762 / NCIMB 9860 / 6-10) TaxID=446465 RepID=C7MAL3_BRAFD|nr:LCP family protein [Brachybacterium faecium]ACU84771.1 cell envelope-related function transcriptional attenuator common domain [Brachybacterium faecium DSM 4810]
MTDPSSDPSRRRRRSGRHQQPARRPQPSPLSPDEARRNRDAAFGGPNPKRTWIGGESAASPTSADRPGSAAQGRPPAAPSPRSGGAGAAESPAASPASSASSAPSASSASPDGTSPDDAQGGAPPPRRPRGRRAAFPLEQLPASPTPGSPAEQDAAASREADEAGTDEPTPSRPGRRRAALPVEPATEPDLWAAEAPPPAAAGQPQPAPDAPTPREEQPAEPAAAAPARPAAAGAASASGVAAASAASTAGPESAGTTSGAAPRAETRTEHSAAPAGSLPRVALWTVLTSLLPGSGLLTTRMRRLGWTLLVLLLLAVVAAVVFLLVGDPLRTGAMLATKRSVLIGAMIAVGVVGVVWALQIVLANLAHSTRERLAGAKRYLALGLAALMVVAVALPFGRGVQSLWALQGLMGSETVFGGGEGGTHSFATGKDPWANTERLNIMLLGQDAGEDRTGTRPDTIMVASIDTKTGKTALFSIPRNLENVEFPEGTPAAEEFPNGFDYFGKNQNLINAVWTWAEDRPDLFPDDPEPGLTATRWAVEETLGLETDYYAMVNLQGFEDMVNALGGVDLVVERPIPIGGGASDVEGYIEPGDQKLDGFHALWYARSREGSNDFNRMCRQQRMVRAVAEEADPTTLALSIPGLVNATEENIQTDIPLSKIDAFVDLALRIKDGGFTSYPITQDVTFTGNPDFDYLKEWAQASIEDSTTLDEPESVVGETEPGSTEPAETGTPPEEEPGAEEPGAEDESPEEEPSSEADSPDAEDPESEESDSGPEIEKDPLKSCLPGYEE